MVYKKVLWRPVGIELFFHVQILMFHEICIAADCAKENDEFKLFEHFLM